MDYTITIKEDVDTDAIDKLHDKIEQLHSGKFPAKSRMGRLHKKIEKIHDEKQLDDYPNIKKLNNKVTQEVETDEITTQQLIEK